MVGFHEGDEAIGVGVLDFDFIICGTENGGEGEYELDVFTLGYGKFEGL